MLTRMPGVLVVSKSWLSTVLTIAEVASGKKTGKESLPLRVLKYLGFFIFIRLIIAEGMIFLEFYAKMWVLLVFR